MTYPKLYLYKAQNANIVAILRRGSTRTEWELIRWDLDTDTFTEGQWLMKKVMNGKYCSLSPNGLYFAYHYDEYKDNGTTFESHGVVSKLPNFTALYHKANFGGNWATLTFTEDNAIVYGSMSTEPMEKKGDIELPFADWETAKRANSGYIDFEKEPVWQDPKGRSIRVDGAKLIVDNHVLYDTSDHMFVAKPPS